MDWPINSDFNRIQAVWDHLDRQWNKRQGLWDVLQEAWITIPIPKRVQTVLKNKGGHTN